MGKERKDTRLMITAFIVLFAGLAVLVFFLINGESRRARLSSEYEAQGIAGDLLDAYRERGSLEGVAVDPRVRAFGVYTLLGVRLAWLGDAPQDISTLPPGLSFDGSRGTLTLVRLQGMGAGMQQYMRGMMRGGMGGAQPARPGAAVYRVMDSGEYARSQRAFLGASILAPVLVAGIAAAFLALLSSNIKIRRQADERERLARLGESARTLAHEIRNPLSAIRIQTALLRKKIPADSATGLDVIDEETGRLSVLAARVGDFIKNPGGQPEDILLGPFIAETAGRLSFPVAVAPDTPGLRVRFDRELLRSVLENLMRNAHESYPDGDEAGVEVRADLEDGQAVVRVMDRGRGIAPELADKVFDPFTTDKIHGFGLGLSLSRRFVEAAGGVLTLHPREGGGTEARMRLPPGRAE